MKLNDLHSGSRFLISSQVAKEVSMAFGGLDPKVLTSALLILDQNSVKAFASQ